MTAPTLSLILPLYKEEGHLAKSLTQIDTCLKQLRIPYEIIMVEDHSPDATLAIARKFSSGKKYVRLVVHVKNQGRGKAVRDGIIAAKGKIAGFIDVDLETPAYFIGVMIDPLLKKVADLSIGHRIYNVHLSTLPRFFLSRGYFYLVRGWLGLPFHDTEAGYKFFNRRTITPVLTQCKDYGWFFDTEIVANAYLAGLTIQEIPVLFLRNPEKISTVKPFRDSIEYLRRLWEFRQKKRYFTSPK